MNDSQLGSQWIKNRSKYGPLVGVTFSGASAPIKTTKDFTKWLDSNNPILNPNVDPAGPTKTASAWKTEQYNSHSITQWTKTTSFNKSPEVKEVGRYYLITKDYEKHNGISSKEMFSKWKKGQVRGPQYTDWVNAYIKVWRAID